MDPQGGNKHLSPQGRPLVLGLAVLSVPPPLAPLRREEGRDERGGREEGMREKGAMRERVKVKLKGLQMWAVTIVN